MDDDGDDDVLGRHGILPTIFGYLGPEDLTSVAQVSRRWTKEVETTRRRGISTSARVHSEAGSTRINSSGFFRCFSGFKFISLDSCNFVESAPPEEVIGFQNLSQLAFFSCSSFGKFFHELWKLSPNLEKLKIFNNRKLSRRDFEFVDSSLRKFGSKLRLYAGSFTDKQDLIGVLKSLADGCPNLQNLLLHTGPIKFPLLVCRELSRFRRLERLELCSAPEWAHNCVLDETRVNILANGLSHSLRSLTLIIDITELDLVCKFMNLRKLLLILIIDDKSINEWTSNDDDDDGCDHPAVVPKFYSNDTHVIQRWNSLPLEQLDIYMQETASQELDVDPLLSFLARRFSSLPLTKVVAAVKPHEDTILREGIDLLMICSSFLRHFELHGQSEGKLLLDAFRQVPPSMKEICLNGFNFLIEEQEKQTGDHSVLEYGVNSNEDDDNDDDDTFYNSDDDNVDVVDDIIITPLDARRYLRNWIPDSVELKITAEYDVELADWPSFE